MSTYYVYDTRTQIEKPVFVVYDEKHVELVCNALFGGLPDHIMVTTYRLHKHTKGDGYVAGHLSNSNKRR